MGTFLVKDNFPRHARFVAVDDAAVGVWVQCLAYANEQETDGFIPTGALRWVSRSREADALKSVRALVKAGLLAETEGGWTIHDYLQHNPSKEDRSAKREAARLRMVRSKEPKEPKKAAVAAPETPAKPPDASREFRAKEPRRAREESAKGSGTSRALPALQDQDQDQDQVSADADAAASGSGTLPAEPAAAAAAGTSGDERGPDPAPEAPPAAGLEAQLEAILVAHTASAKSGLDLPDLAHRLAFAGDARKPAHVLAAVRRALDEAAPQHLANGKLVKLVLRFAERASERDLPPPQEAPAPASTSDGPKHPQAAPLPTSAELAEFAAASAAGAKALEALRKAGGAMPHAPKEAADG